MTQKHLTEGQKELLFADLVEFTERNSLVFTLDGPQTVTVKKKDNTYRKKPIERRAFFLENVYLGKTDANLAFQFDDLTEDVQEYACVEFSTKTVDTGFPMFLDEAVKPWACQRYVSRDASREAHIAGAQTVKDLFNMAFNFEVADSDLIAQESEDALTSLPTFGMF